jgi:hypothetical protein
MMIQIIAVAAAASSTDIASNSSVLRQDICFLPLGGCINGTAPLRGRFKRRLRTRLMQQKISPVG